MLHGEGNEKGKKNNKNHKIKKKKTKGKKKKKKNIPAWSTRFFLHFFAVVFDYYNVKVPILVTRFIEEMSHE